MVLFVIGFGNLMLQSNLIKNYRAEYYGYGSIPLLAEKGYITSRAAPIVADGVQKRGGIYQSVPSGLVLTGIVVSVSVSALMLSTYHTFVPEISYIGFG